MHAKSNRRYNMMKSFLEEFLMKIQDEMSSLQFLLVAAVSQILTILYFDVGIVEDFLMKIQAFFLYQNFKAGCSNELRFTHVTMLWNKFKSFFCF